MMVVVEAIAVLAVVVILAYAAYAALTTGQASRRVVTAGGHWEAAHYAARGSTRVVVRRVAPTGDLLDEHVVAEIPDEDPGFDDRFLAAMAQARERAALFESEA